MNRQTGQPSGTPSAEPDPLRHDHGAKVRDLADWAALHRLRVDRLVGTLYGPLPPVPDAVAVRELYQQSSRRFGGVEHRHFALMLRGPGGSLPLYCDLLAKPDPPKEGWPLMIHGDGCWLTAGEPVIGAVLDRGFALLRFNRVHVAPDSDLPRAEWPLHGVFPEMHAQAIAAWAWAHHRAVDLAVGLSEVDAGRIALVGHSRGGKTVLLAGATDPRVALVAANNSGCAGAGSFKRRTEGCERLEALLRRFPHWLGREVAGYSDREAELPFDQHVLLAAFATRALITLEADDDRWANPEGTAAMHDAARPVFARFGNPEHLRLHRRPGPHGHRPEDWHATLDFASEVFGL